MASKDKYQVTGEPVFPVKGEPVSPERREPVYPVVGEPVPSPGYTPMPEELQALVEQTRQIRQDPFMRKGLADQAMLAFNSSNSPFTNPCKELKAFVKKRNSLIWRATHMFSKKDKFDTDLAKKNIGKLERHSNDLSDVLNKLGKKKERVKSGRGAKHAKDDIPQLEIQAQKELLKVLKMRNELIKNGIPKAKLEQYAPKIGHILSHVQNVIPGCVIENLDLLDGQIDKIDSDLTENLNQLKESQNAEKTRERKELGGLVRGFEGLFSAPTATPIPVSMEYNPNNPSPESVFGMIVTAFLAEQRQNPQQAAINNAHTQQQGRSLSRQDSKGSDKKGVATPPPRSPRGRKR